MGTTRATPTIGEAGDEVPTLEERRDALRARFPVWEPQTTWGWMVRRAEEFGPRPFVIADERTVTYREVVDWATRLADGLAALGVRPGERVGLLMANHLEFAPLKLAIARAGAVAIPFNFLYRREELEYVLRQSRCSTLITMDAFGDLRYLEMLDEIAPGWADAATPELPELRAVVQRRSGDAARDGVLTVEGLAALGDRHPGASDGAEGRPDEVGDILYTSGTTGAPKGVMVTHDAVLRTAFASALTSAFEDGRRILFSLPCYHMFGYLEGVLASTVVGGAIVPQLRFSAEGYLAGVERHRATQIHCVPTMTVAILEHPERERYDLSSLRAILCGSAPGPQWLWEALRDEVGIPEVFTGYGMTETGGPMTFTLPEDPPALTTETVGRPKLAGVAGLPDAGGAICRYKTVDPVTFEDLPEGEEGELASSGPTTMVGFWDKPEETARALRDGWVLSGDLGRVRADGYVELTGRSKELYKSGGELIMPKEVEAVLAAHPGVSQAYAVGVPDDRWGEAGCAWVVRAPGHEASADELLDHCRAHLARFKVPKHVLFVAAGDLPTTPTGKVQKFRLVTRAAAEIDAGRSSS